MSDCEDLDGCHKFRSEIFPFIGPFSQRFVCLDCSVCDEEFVIKVDYDKDQFEHLIQEYVYKIPEELKNSCTVIIGQFIELCVRMLKFQIFFVSIVF